MDLCRRTAKFDVVTHTEKGLVLWGQPRPTSRERDPSASTIFGGSLLCIFVYTLCRRTTKFDVVTHVGRGVYLGLSHASHPKTAEFQRFPI